MGWSTFSPIGYILASTTPSSPVNPQTKIVGTNVEASWNVPSDTGGLNVPIISYTVEIKQQDAFVAFCTSSTLACLVPMQTLLQAPLAMNQGDPIMIRVTATNVVGTGPTSELSSTVYALV